MTTLSNILFATMFSIGLASAVQAAPGDAEEEQRITVLTSQKDDCSVRQGLCISAGAKSTRPVATLLAAAGDAPVSTADSSLFLRAISDSANRRYEEDAVPWTVDVSAAFRKRALAGNTLFILTDTEDADQAAGSNTVTALFQAPIQGGDRATVRLVLHPQDGFRAGHTYRLRVVQLIAGKEVELTSGLIGLLG